MARMVRRTQAVFHGKSISILVILGDDDEERETEVYLSPTRREYGPQPVTSA